MRYFVLFMVALLSTFSAYARLGDSYQGSTKRFGKALNYFKDKYAEVGLFEYKGFAIFVIYRNGRSIEESYMKLAPGIKAKITGQKYFPIYTLNQPKNLLPLKEKTRDALRSANFKAKWSLGDKITLNGIEEMTAVKGDKKVSGDYYIARKVLVIKNENPPPAPKAPKSEVEMAKSLCLPLGSDFNDYMNKLGIPYRLSAPSIGDFQHNEYIVTVFFKNDEKEKTKSQEGQILVSLIKGMIGGKSKMVDYTMLQNNFIEKNIHHFKSLKKTLDSHKYKNKLSIDNEIKYMKEESSLSLSMHSNQSSIPSNIIDAFLSNTANASWTRIPPQKIGEDCYSAWKDGRRLYAIYNIVWKYLRIKFGTKSEDYRPEVIKKLKEKAEVDALKNF